MADLFARASAVELADGIGEAGPASCIMCGSQWIGGGRIELHGAAVGLCGECGGLVRSRCWPEGAFDALTCLHLMACEIEDCIPTADPGLPGHRSVATLSEARVLRQLRRRFPVARFRRVCPCETCEGWRAGRVPGPAPPLAVGVAVSATEARELRDQCLRDNAAATVPPPLDLRGLGGLARPWRPPVVNVELRAVQDELARAYFADDARITVEGLSCDWAVLRDVSRRVGLLAKWPELHPGGRFDGRWWIDGDGVCHELTPV